MTYDRILECPNCGRQVGLDEPEIGGTFIVRCQSGRDGSDRCHHEMEPSQE